MGDGMMDAWMDG